MTTLQSAILLNAVILAITLLSDLGHRRITLHRILRPLITTAVVVPFFLHQFFSSGIGLYAELAGVASGVLIGLLVIATTRVERGPKGLVSVAGWPYAAVWCAVAIARTIFSIALEHGFGRTLGTFMVEHGAAPSQIGNVLTDGLVLMAIVAVLTRSLALGAKARTARSALATTAA